MANETDEGFARTLLASAGGDAQPDAAARARAWERFASALGPALADPALHGQPPAAGPADVRVPPSAGGASGPVFSSAALKWLVVGAIGGGALVGAVRLGGWRATPPREGPAAVEEGPPSPAPAAGPRGAADGSGPPAAGPEPKRPRSMTTSEVRARPADVAGEAPGSERGRVQRSSSRPRAGRGSVDQLASEVALLDAARAARARGDTAEAVAIVGRYHRAFPRGRLRPDADVVAIEAVAASGDAAETARRAALFLRRYPHDPHAARVRALAAASRSSGAVAPDSGTFR